MKLIHFCILDPTCWRHWALYGMPMRLYIGKKFFITVLPGPSPIKDSGRPVQLMSEEWEKSVDPDPDAPEGC